ncbi:hypothetical protein MMC15_000018 [Xylographa vitiligo]|nr:hypothetical protein [Xylographa vitiligo]
MPTHKAKPVVAENPCLPDLTNPNDLTIWNPGQTVYTEDNPHPILGRLDPPPSWYIKEISYLEDNDGKPLVDREGCQIRDWPGWPRYISSQIGGHDLEVLFRASCRVTYRDIWARQPRWVKKPDSIMTNRMNQRRLREGRQPVKGVCWSQRYASRAPPKTVVLAVAELTADQIRYNTNFLIKNNALISHNGGQVLPLDYYVSGAGLHKPSMMVYDALLLIHRLAHTTRTKQLLHSRAQVAANSPVSRRRRRTSTQTKSNKKAKVDVKDETADENKSSDVDDEFLYEEDLEEDTGTGSKDPDQTTCLRAYEKYYDGGTVKKAAGVEPTWEVDQFLNERDDEFDQEEYNGLDEEIFGETEQEEYNDRDEEMFGEWDQEDNEENDENDDKMSDDELDGEFEHYDENDFISSTDSHHGTNTQEHLTSSNSLYEDQENDEGDSKMSDDELDGEFEYYDENEFANSPYYSHGTNAQQRATSPDSLYEDEMAMEAFGATLYSRMQALFSCSAHDGAMFN